MGSPGGRGQTSASGLVLFDILKFFDNMALDIKLKLSIFAFNHELSVHVLSSFSGLSEVYQVQGKPL